MPGYATLAVTKKSAPENYLMVLSFSFYGRYFPLILEHPKSQGQVWQVCQ